jgi:hypothetical protein
MSLAPWLLQQASPAARWLVQKKTWCLKWLMVDGIRAVDCGPDFTGLAAGTWRVLDDLVARRGDRVDVQHIGEFGEVDQHVGDLVGHLGALGGGEGQAFLGVDPLEMLDQLGGLDRLSAMTRFFGVW